jgi:hypothetical protein
MKSPQGVCEMVGQLPPEQEAGFVWAVPEQEALRHQVVEVG